MNELEVKDLEVALPGVTVLSYDLDTTETPDINDFIRQILLDDGWQDEIGNIIVRQLGIQDVLTKANSRSPLCGKGSVLLHRPSMSLSWRCWLIIQAIKVLVLMEKPWLFVETNMLL